MARWDVLRGLLCEIHGVLGFRAHNFLEACVTVMSRVAGSLSAARHHRTAVALSLPEVGWTVVLLESRVVIFASYILIVSIE